VNYIYRTLSVSSWVSRQSL